MLLQLDNPIEVSVSVVLIGAIIAGWYYLNTNDQKFSRKVLKYIAGGSGLVGLLIFVFSLQLTFEIFPYIGVALILLAFLIYPKRLVLDRHAQNLSKAKETQWREHYRKEYDTAMTEGIAAFKRKAFDIANENFIQALKMYPNSAEAWFYLGEINFFRKRFAEARKAYEQAVSRRSDYSEAQKRLQEIDQL
ncbi:MAG: tetratricopeptide repeat protein [Promethearchaeota archaeon]